MSMSMLGFPIRTADHSERKLEQNGQITLFIALIFQVLFVFFAMTINIGLIVHDKINLQNSVDLAVYYAAQKQAEVLNAIAHINYQMHQDYKLMAFRYRAIGGFGYENHPAHRLMPLTQMDTDVNIQEISETPSVCINHPMWAEAKGANTSLCRAPEVSIVQIPRVRNIASFLPINSIASAFYDRQRARIGQECVDATRYNWLYAATLYSGFRYSVLARKKAITRLAQTLSARSDDFLDIDSNSVLKGVMATLQKNLTQSNRDSLGQVILYNSLAEPLVEDRPPRWLSDILISPRVLYSYFLNNCKGDVSSELRDINSPPRDAPDGALLEMAKREFNSEDPGEASLGFEKNPWVMAYVGLKAQTAPRKPFAPFGQAVTMLGRAFAKPFGGRLGPWYASQWIRGDSLSSGKNQTDPLVPPRIQGAQEFLDITDKNLPRFLPNYSRFPGDTLGLKSRLSLTLGKDWLNRIAGNSILFFSHFSDLMSVDADFLSLELNTQGGGEMRQLELAAISPDLFDITYFSIEPDFARNYAEKKLSVMAKMIGDLGSRTQPPQLPGGPAAQVGIALSLPTYGQYFYLIRDIYHALTGWVQDQVSDYTTFPINRFGICYSPPVGVNLDPPTPGNCVSGGRTGYSVKLISKDYLLSSLHQLGGPEVAVGPLLNPPPSEF